MCGLTKRLNPAAPQESERCPPRKVPPQPSPRRYALPLRVVVSPPAASKESERCPPQGSPPLPRTVSLGDLSVDYYEENTPVAVLPSLPSSPPTGRQCAIPPTNAWYACLSPEHSTSRMSLR